MCWFQSISSAVKRSRWPLRPTDPSFVIQRSQHQSIPVMAYLQLGIYHILFGIDHLLFCTGIDFACKRNKATYKNHYGFHHCTQYYIGSCNAPSGERAAVCCGSHDCTQHCFSGFGTCAALSGQGRTHLPLSLDSSFCFWSASWFRICRRTQ